jgi:hypothetical protein
MIHILFLYTPVSYQIANVFQFFLFTGHINPEQVFVSGNFIIPFARVICCINDFSC